MSDLISISCFHLNFSLISYNGPFVILMTFFPCRISVKPYGAIGLEGNVRLNLCQQQKAPFVGMTWWDTHRRYMCHSQMSVFQHIHPSSSCNGVSKPFFLACMCGPTPMPCHCVYIDTKKRTPFITFFDGIIEELSGIRRHRCSSKGDGWICLVKREH